MTNPIVQTSFNSGEWAPALYARVDLAKYHSGAALIRNFTVDYRGGVTTRPGTRYILKTRQAPNRLIPFSASFGVTYMLEFGPQYIRFISNGAYVLEGFAGISSITQANPGHVVLSGNVGYANGDWIFISNVGGMTPLNGNYYIIKNVSNPGTTSFDLTDLFGNNVDTTGFPAYTSGGAVQRVYTLISGMPYQGQDLFGIKYSQNVNYMVLCHPNYPPYLLTLISATNWTIAPLSFGTTINAPTGLSTSTTAAAGPPNYSASYVVTAVDANGQESAPSNTATLTNLQLQTACTNTFSWAPVTGAVSYNVYRTILVLNAAPPSGSMFGFVGNVTGNQFVDTNIGPNFAIGPPVVENPFSGSGVAQAALSNGGSNYTVVPQVNFVGGSPTSVASAVCSLTTSNNISLNNAGSGYNVGDILTGPYGISIGVNSVTFPTGAIATFGVRASGSQSNTGTSVQTTNLGLGGSATGSRATVNVVWQVNNLVLTSPGAGYTSTPAITFTNGGSGSGASAVAALGAASNGNPTVPGFFQQRMFLGGPVLSPSQLNLSQPGTINNFNVTSPAQADNAIQETLTNTTLNAIKSVAPVSAGLIVFTDKGAWLVNGGSPGSAISALGIVANPQAYSGASDLPPILTTSDVLYVQAKGSIVRDLAYNFYLANYVGTDISILSSHLFYGFTIIQWTWAEEPFKTVWAVRSDGTMLTLAFIKEQELIAWAHSDTQGTYQSVASITEATSIGNVDAVYTITQRTINGVVVNYVERNVELNYPLDYKSSWQVDAGIGYAGGAATTFSGAQHLAGMAVTGVADGVVINFTMPTSGTFVFGPGGTPGLTNIPNAQIVTVGLAFSPQLTTLPIDLGEPTVQGKRKVINGTTIRVANALGLSMGRTIASALPMQDLILGNVGSQTNAPVTGLVTGDVRGYQDPQWDEPGQFSIIQTNPYPASILGVIPEIQVGDA